MSEDEYGYQEDFDESEIPDNYQERQPEREEDDEQHTQKINGKLEALQQQVETLRQELEQERRMSLEVRQQYERELQLAWQKQSSAEEQRNNAVEGSISNEELERYKKKCQVLEDKLEMALLTGNSVEKVPMALEEAFHKLCKSNHIFPEHSDKVLNINDCISILKLADTGKGKKRSTTGTSEQGSAPPSADGGALRSTNTVNRLSERVRNLEEELRVAEAAGKDAENLKNKIFQASERIRIEKEQKRALEIELNASRKKIEMLGDHIEKLVVHIKREGAQKIRLAEQLRSSEKEATKLKDKNDYVQKKSSAKDRLILELREGSKVLEDQLRLMDEKYLELRGKLDYARAIAGKKIRKAEKVAAELRVKFALSGSPHVLDSLPMPNEYSVTFGAGEEGFDNDDHGWGVENGGHSRSAMLPPKKSGSVRSLVSKGKGNSRGMALETMSLSSGMTQKSEPTLDGVLDKIKYQQGSKPEWTEDKAKLLVKSR